MRVNDARAGQTRTDTVEALAGRLLRCISAIHSRGWCEATSGNFSALAGREPLRLLVTRSGFDKGAATAQDLLTVDERGGTVDGRGKPSDEVLLHVTLARDAGAGAILHTHSVWGTLLGERFRAAGGLTLRGYEMLKAFDGLATHQAELFVPVLENSQDIPALAERLTQLIRDRPGMRGFLIAGHGLYTWGRDVAEASRHLEAFEFLFQLVGRRVPLEPFTG